MDHLFTVHKACNSKMSCVSQKSAMSFLQRMKTILPLYRTVQNTLPSSSNFLIHRTNVRKGHSMGGPHPGNIPPLSLKVTKEQNAEEIVFEDTDQIDPDDAFEGKDAYKMILPNHESENFSFDPEVGILQEREDEIEYYEGVVKPERDRLDRDRSLKFGDIVHDVDRHHPRDFEVSSDQTEWKFVERLLPMDIVPPLPPAPNEDGSYPSGFIMARAKPGDYPYHISRTRSHMLPVYTVFKRPQELVTTHISNCEGNLHQLKNDLCAFLEDRYEREFISQVGELYGKVRFRGDFEQDFKEFLLEKGF